MFRYVNKYGKQITEKRTSRINDASDIYYYPKSSEI